MGFSPNIGVEMPEVLLFIKDFELGSRVSSACVDLNKNVEFSDEKTDPDSFSKSVRLAIVDMDENVFHSKYTYELQRHRIGPMYFDLCNKFFQTRMIK